MSENQQNRAVCDCHIHCFGREKRAEASRYTPPRKDLTDYRIEARADSIERAVVIQASVDGTDNSRLVKALGSSSDIELRGVAMIDPVASNLDELAAVGVRALRIQDRTRLGVNDLDLLPRIAGRASSMGWHVELNTEPERFGRLATLIRGLPDELLLVLDHMGHIDPLDSEHTLNLCRLLDTGRVWVKLSPTRVSQRIDDYRDLSEIVQHLMSVFPEQCIWGSDWPHVMTEPPLPDIPTMLDFFADVLTESQFHACMWSNPSRLYGF